MNSQHEFKIISCAVAGNVGNIGLAGGKVDFDRKPADGFSAEDYNSLWNALHTLELHGDRSMAPELLPESARSHLTLRVYLGPNSSGQINAVLDLLSTRPHDLTDIISEPALK